MAVIVDCNADAKIFSALKKLNINCYKSASIDELYLPINTHSDMQIHFVDEKNAVVAPLLYDYYQSILPKTISLYPGKNNPEGTYPFDCAYNVAKVGKRLVGNLSYTDPVIIDFYKNLGYDLINTKQGYTKCNLCIVDDNSVITEDEGLRKTLTDAGVSVLKVPVGAVGLKGFPYGFIGGCSGFLDKKQLAFFGDILSTEYGMDIFDFVKSRNVDIICLSQTKPEDYGSLLYFEE